MQPEPSRPQRTAFPTSLAPRSVATGESRVEELPPSARGKSSDTKPSIDLPPTAIASRRWGGWRGAAAAAAIAIGVGLTLLSGPGENEADAPNGPRVAAATQSARAGGEPMQWLSRAGMATLGSEVSVGDRDRDAKTTAAIRQALKAGDMVLADQLLADAQSIARVPDNLPAQKVDPSLPAADSKAATTHSTLDPRQLTPSLTTGMRDEIMRGDTEFFHVYLYDSCWDDGDVVEILINGRPMFIVPITNAGATLSIPVSSSSTTVVAVRGIYDGVGGITVACRTSQGDGFVRVMQPGEVQPLTVVTSSDVHKP